MHCLGRGSCLRQLGESLDAQASGCKGGGIGGYWAMGIRTGIGSEHYHHPHTWMFAAWELGFYVYVHIVIEESYTTTSHWLGRGYPGTHCVLNSQDLTFETDKYVYFNYLK